MSCELPTGWIERIDDPTDDSTKIPGPGSIAATACVVLLVVQILG